ncbi:unnamed protein product, partial [marine sediment metagenome]
ASKGPKDRIVMPADDVLKLCRTYHERVSCILPDYYLHFVPEFFPVFKEKTRETFDDLVPEVDYEKT